MAVYTIPVTSENASYSQRMAFDGRMFRLAFKYIDRLEKWVLSISRDDGTPLVSGITLVPGIDLLKAYVSAGIPQGQLYLINLEVKNGECGRTDLGTACRLYYVDEAD